jgi:2',3'-cyclic-nucleotide 2'-phosphodiesterase (5'-nucleotidase family)
MSTRSSTSAAQPPRNDFSLPLGEINVVVVTDVHSWVAGHARHGELFDADYGDVVSFNRRLQSHPTFLAEARDLFFVMNGDFVDGTGLSTVPPTHLTPILRKMPWDAVNMVYRQQ